MWPTFLIHHCSTCSNDNPVPYSASVFSETHYCNNCGATSVGVHVKRPPTYEEEKATAMQQDELAGLFARTMTFSNPTPPPDEHQTLSKPVEYAGVETVQQEQQVQPIVYASAHYIPNRTFHATPAASPEPEPTPVFQSIVQPLTDSEMIEILQRNSIDPHSLFPSQVNLFRNADNDQRLRLLELWRISPPNLGSYDLAKEQATWLETTLQQEEQMAKLRYERLMQERQFGAQQQQTQQDSQVEEEMLAAPADLARPASAPEIGSSNRHSLNYSAEPYMTSGYEASMYEQLAAREYERTEAALQEPAKYSQATDPAYRGSASFDRSHLQEMENRYGAFEESRFMDGPSANLNGLDEEMVM